LKRIEEAAVDLAENNCDVVIVGGSPLFTRLGYGSDIEVGRALTKKTGIPIFAGITGEVEALRRLGVKKVVVATPHEDELNQRMKKFLEASGFEVPMIEGYGIRKNSEIADLSEHAAYRIAKKLYEKAPEADGIFVPCPRWPTIGDVALLESEIGKPVVTSCQAYIWYALELAHVREKIDGYGKLMGTLGEHRG
jgi:maleate isomerase